MLSTPSNEENLSQVQLNECFEMLKIVIETSSYVHLVVGFKIGQPWYKFILPKLSLTFDELRYFGNPPSGKLLLSSPHGKFTEIHKDVLRLATNYAPPTDEQLEDLA
jgi:hypothetical protein